MTGDKRVIKQFADYDADRRWWRTGWATLPEVSAGMALPQSVVVKDDTLREGVLAPGATSAGRFGFDARVDLGRRLVKAGITEGEVGYTVRLTETETMVRRLKAEVPTLELSIHAQLWGEWSAVDEGANRVVAAGADRLNFLLLTDRLWDDLALCLRRVRDGVRLAAKLGVPASFGTLQLLMEPAVFAEVAGAAIDEGADRIVVYDGHGCAFPAAMRRSAQFVRERWPAVDIEVHCHNDMGLGTALTLAAVEGGANVVDVSLNGLGNRAGIAALEEVVMALEVLYRVPTGVDLRQLTALSRFVEDESGIQLQVHKPIVGRHISVHESAVHIEQILRGDQFAWEVFDPKVVGQESRIVFGPTSLDNGYRALRAFMEKRGHLLGDDELTRLAEEIKRRLARERYLEADAVLALWTELTSR